MACRSVPHSEGILLRLLNPSPHSVDVSLNLHPKVGEAQLFALDDLTPMQAQFEKISAGILRTSFKPFEIKTWKLFPC
jgi:hypothetical protein